MVTRKKQIAFASLILTCLVSTVGAAAYFVLNKPASIEILVNTYTVELYNEQSMATTIVDSLTFPSIIADSPIVTSKTDVMYLFATESAGKYTLNWTCAGLPTGLSVIAHWNYAGELFYQWNENQEMIRDLVLPDSGSNGMRIYFEITSNGASVGNYNINIQIFAGV